MSVERAYKLKNHFQFEGDIHISKLSWTGYEVHLSKKRIFCCCFKLSSFLVQYNIQKLYLFLFIRAIHKTKFTSIHPLFFQSFVKLWCPLLYILTSVWVLCTSNTGWNSYYWHFCAKKLKKCKKSNKFGAKFNKKISFLNLHQNAGRKFFSQKELFSCFQMFFLVIEWKITKKHLKLQKKKFAK